MKTKRWQITHRKMFNINKKQIKAQRKYHYITIEQIKLERLTIPSVEKMWRNQNPQTQQVKSKIIKSLWKTDSFIKKVKPTP